MAAVELAVCLPFFLLIFFATLDVCGMFHVGQSLTIASYEGARVGVVPEAEASNVQFQCQTLLDAQGVSGYTVTMNPSDPGTLNVGAYFTVTITANYDSNAFGAGLYSGKTITKSVTLKVE